MTEHNIQRNTDTERLEAIQARADAATPMWGKDRTAQIIISQADIPWLVQRVLDLEAELARADALFSKQHDSHAKLYAELIRLKATIANVRDMSADPSIESFEDRCVDLVNRMRRGILEGSTTDHE